MRLKRYRVTNFRSVEDSGWVDTDDVTALIGVNESGKSNMLVPLWKLNPAREGDLRPTSDYPKTKFAEIREHPEDFMFIEAEFDTADFAKRLAVIAGLSVEQASVVKVSRWYDGKYTVNFPKHEHITTASSADLIQIISSAIEDINKIPELPGEDGFKDNIISGVRRIVADIPEACLGEEEVSSLAARIRSVVPESVPDNTSIAPRLEALAVNLDETSKRISSPDPGTKVEVLDAVIKNLPKFVYYSNYGNLDSEIYLPHVVENLSRSDLGEKEAAKARTLKVLFSFVRLKPSEILALGQDLTTVGNPPRRPTEVEIAATAEKKRERSILLQSAGNTLTERFKDWWKQGNYRFRFDADGNHFRIWVADDKRPAEVELEGRSTGLQWFLSFYLVFLVESGNAGEHDNAILLLDEPGLSLHPLAQNDLSKFFDNLSKTNQILYTTHSPFLVHADRLDRARKIYVDAKGTTQATSDLRKGTELQPGAAYAVHSALGLSVADSLMLGCQPVIVEGSSDQHYLTAMKTLLISAGRLKPSKEIIFPPAGGTKNTKMVASILTGRDEDLPYMVLDGDLMGQKLAKEVRSTLYQDAPEKLIIVDTYTGMAGSEIEDLIPNEILAAAVDRMVRADTEFADIIHSDKPIVGQIEEWTKSQGVSLVPGWKVELSKRVKQQLLMKGISIVPPVDIDRWEKLFAAFGGGSNA